MKIKKVLLTTLALGMVLSIAPSPLFAYSYYLWNDWGGSYWDAEKSPASDDDDLMCWAAAASNVLAWTGWGSNTGSADDIFAYYQTHWTDDGGNPYYAWEWWFTGVNASQGEDGWSQVDVAGGDFWSAENEFEDYVWSTRRSGDDWLAMNNIERLLTDGYGTVLSVTDNDGGHALTVWGYEKDDDGNFLGIYVTDSDDDKSLTDPADVLAYYDIVNSGSQWFLQDFYGQYDWYITEVQGLLGVPVPLPASIVFFGFGLLITVSLRRRQVNPDILSYESEEVAEKIWLT